MTKTVGEFVREARLATGLSLRLAARAACLPLMALQRTEKSNEPYLARETIDRLVEVYVQFGVPPNYLRCLAPPGIYPNASKTALPALRPAVLSTYERQAVRRWIEAWIATSESRTGGCRQIDAELKAKIALEALRYGASTVEVAHRYQVQPHQVAAWKKELRDKAAMIFRVPKTKG